MIPVKCKKNWQWRFILTNNSQQIEIQKSHSFLEVRLLTQHSASVLVTVKCVECSGTARVKANGNKRLSPHCTLSLPGEGFYSWDASPNFHTGSTFLPTSQWHSHQYFRGGTHQAWQNQQGNLTPLVAHFQDTCHLWARSTRSHPLGSDVNIQYTKAPPWSPALCFLDPLHIVLGIQWQQPNRPVCEATHTRNLHDLWLPLRTKQRSYQTHIELLYAHTLTLRNNIITVT